MRARSILSATALASLLILGTDYVTFAATGGSLILGRSNSAGATTKVTNTGNGAALTLNSRAGQPPLAVSNTTKVGRLNADLLDGLDSSSFARTTTTRVFNLQNTSGGSWALPLDPGVYQISYNVPMVAGAGASPFTATCLLVQEDGSAITRSAIATTSSAEANRSVGVTASSVVGVSPPGRVSAGTKLWLTCSANASWSLGYQRPSQGGILIGETQDKVYRTSAQVVATPLNSITGSNLPAS